LLCSDKTAEKYKWYYNGILVQEGDNDMYIANQKLGKYNVSVSNLKGCFTVSDTLTIPFGVTAIEDADPFKTMILYPNPSSGKFAIEMNNNISGELDVRIFTSEGKQVLNMKLEKSFGHFLGQIDLTGHKKGIYLISLSIDGFISNKKIIIE
jgi:hypothetical protein